MSGKPIGRVGLLVRDREGQVLALTSALVAPVNQRLALTGETSAKLEVSRTLAVPRKSSTPDASAMIAAVRLPRLMAFNALVGGVNHRRIATPFDPDAHQALFLASATTRRRLGAMLSIGATVRIRTLDGQVQVFDNAIEIDKVDSSPIGSGDAGLLVVAERGDLVGLVVGATARSILVAPLGEALLRHELEPVTAFDATKRQAVIGLAAADVARRAALRRPLTRNRLIERRSDSDRLTRKTDVLMARVAKLPEEEPVDA